MQHARLVFFPDLPFFLARSQPDGVVPFAFQLGQTVKHLAESAGVPHTEIGRIAVNGAAVGFDYQVGEGENVEIFAATAENCPISGEARFVLDNHLGRLAAYLRMLGFDAAYQNDLDDEALARIADEEERILLTRDRRLLMRKIVRRGYCPRSLDSYRQAEEVLRRFDLASWATPFRRCLRCNAPLAPVQKAEVLDRLEPLTRLYYEEFHRCPACGQIYWKGSHYERMQALVDSLRSENSGALTRSAS